MTREDDPDTHSDARKGGLRDSIPSATTDEEFHEILRAYVTESDSKGVDVRGSWPVTRDDTERAWDIEITRVSKRSTATIESGDPPASAVVDAVAEREGVETTALPPLYEAIEPDVLTTVHDADADSGKSVTFEYVGYTITVRADGTIVLEK